MSNLNLKNLKYERNEVKILLLVSCLFFVISLGAWLISMPGARYKFYFESADTGKLSVEHRNLPLKSYPENVLRYVDELVAGPRTERFKGLFSAETHIISRFVHDGVLYVNLSSDVLDRAGSCSEIKTGIELFKRNVMSNFGKINSVEMYIDNRSIYTSGDEDF
ncbi:MAG: GerMN domain-containing protein [Treponema sp.]|nr:GerMN domain-containing protein [Candidatus Treponema scatequi]